VRRDVGRVLVNGELASLVILSQDIHKIFGGGRTRAGEPGTSHTPTLPAVVDRALAEAGLPASAIDAVAVTAGPGLAGALSSCRRSSTAKTFAYAGNRALIGVHQ